MDRGAFYAGYSEAEDRKKVLAKANLGSLILGWPHSRPATDTDPGIEKRLVTYEIPNADGVRIRLGISEFREGYDLWLITPAGFAQRT